jgi:phosphoglycolate phosphatase
MSLYDPILFDLDGTLTNSEVGIISGVRHALTRMGMPVSDLTALRPFIGPPLHHSFQAYCQCDEATSFQAVAWYREYYDTIGIYEQMVYPGIPELLARLHEQGRRIIMATSKPTVYAGHIVQHFGLASYFDAIVGSELDGTRTDKAEVIAAALTALPGIDPSQAVMVGDREHDIMGAWANDICVVAVGYGFGTPEELRAAGVKTICPSVAALAQFFEEH